jgi:CDP-glucose 4,6-dehydratase
MDSIIGDVRDLPSLNRAVRDSQPEIVIHMAAQSLVRESYRLPVETFATNVMGTVHLLEAVRTVAGVKGVVNITSDKCYQNNETMQAYREADAMGGFDPYSSSKGCAELVSAAYRSSYFDLDDPAQKRVALATARAGNVIGGGDWANDRLIPDILRAFEADSPVQIRNPGAIRPWQHVLEPLRGYLMLAERLYESGEDYSEAWNFGPEDSDAKPVAWIVEKMAQLWGQGAQWNIKDGADFHEAGCLRLDISKARSRLGWKPLVGLGRAMETTVDWARARRCGRDMREFTLEQIRTYQNLATGG